MAFNKYTKNTNEEIAVKIIKDFGPLSEEKNGWAKRLIIADWGKGPKWDLRPWRGFGTPEQKCQKGTTLTDEEVEALFGILVKENGEGK